MNKVLFALSILITTSLFAVMGNAALIHGTIYDTSLTRIDGSVVGINTRPEQRLVAIDGKYAFNVPKGNYIIRASYLTEDLTNLKTIENITIDNDGDFVLDLFLLPELDEINETDIDIDPDSFNNDNNTKFIILIVILSVIGISVVLYVLLPKRFAEEKHPESDEDHDSRKEEHLNNKKETYLDEDAEKVIEILKKENGRMNQKDLRKMFAMSEAKMSLLISELEAKEKVEKIKKGRGNIIILKK
ncbi:hypothetical protein J4214_00580 [Candidatus Woesearchaeota archaeon]|nr:hypothetical protein [Candidatus Woesearchaeota archaeon]